MAQFVVVGPILALGCAGLCGGKEFLPEIPFGEGGKEFLALIAGAPSRRDNRTGAN